VKGRAPTVLSGPAALLAGFVFALGLAVSGMTQPAKVVGFLDFFGHWDPSLAFVMAGAVAVYAVANRAIRRTAAPLFAEHFSTPGQSAIDARLIGGAALFGVGWGMSGFCPGPSLVSFGAATRAALWFVPAAVAGMVIYQRTRRNPSAGDG
jgi:hypothetical protein